MPLSTWLLFFAASWLISLSPGPGAVQAMSSGLRHGFRRGLWTIPGLQLGVIMQVAIVGAGVGALVTGRPVIFETVRWFGVAYLLWLGVRQWRDAPRPLQLHAGRGGSPIQIMGEAFLVNAGNPKAIVFMLAVLPQFIAPNLPQWPQYAICCLTLMFTDMVVMAGYNALARALVRLMNRPEQMRWVNRGFGALFVFVALALALWRHGGR
jgi:homoserine/homoserine lactone efflux protein